MYELRPPAPALRPFIENYWFVRHAPGESVELCVDVYVDARADLIFNFGAPYLREIIGEQAVEYSHSNLDAQRTVPIRITQRGAIQTSGVRFRLGGLGPFARSPLANWTGATPRPADVLGETAAALEGALAACLQPTEQADLLDAYFLAKMNVRSSKSAQTPDITIRRTLSKILSK